VYLPILGVHFISILTKRYRFWLMPGYVLASLFVLWMILETKPIEVLACTGRYVAFQLSDPLSHVYLYYYVMSLAAGVILILWNLRQRTRQMRPLVWLLVGYLSFILPTMYVYQYIFQTRKSFSSVLCGFAIIMAVILVGKILPAVATSPKKGRT
jgi:hypothetical protein